MSTHPVPDTFLRLLDGQLSEEQSHGVRAHAATCQACGKQLARSEALTQRIGSSSGAPADALRARLLERIAQTPQLSSSPARGAPTWMPLDLGRKLGLGLAVAGIAAVVLVPTLRRTEPAFIARGGGTPASVKRDVGIRYYIAGTPLRPLASGATLSADAPIVASYRNAAKTSAYLLSVAVDSAGKVHWLQPGEGATASVELSPHDGEVPLPETVVLDSPAPGPLRILTLVTPRPLSPAALEGGPSASALAGRFPDAAVSETLLTVVP